MPLDGTPDDEVHADAGDLDGVQFADHEHAVDVVGDVVCSELQNVAQGADVVVLPGGEHRLGGEPEVAVRTDESQQVAVLRVVDVDDDRVAVVLSKCNTHVLISS